MANDNSDVYERLTQIECQVEEIEHRLHTLVHCVQYRNDRAYWEFLLKASLDSEEEEPVLDLALRAIHWRMHGQPIPMRPKYWMKHPVVRQAFQEGKLSLDEAAHIIEPLVGDKAEQAIRAFECHLKEM